MSQLSVVCDKLIAALPVNGALVAQMPIPGTWQYAIGLLLARPSMIDAEEIDFEILYAALSSVKIDEDVPLQKKYIDMAKTVVNLIIKNWYAPSAWYTQALDIIEEYNAAIAA